MPESDQRKTLVVDIPGGARELDICENSFRKLIKDGKIRVVRIGRRVVIPRTSLEAFLSGAK